jgi:hypothetical protein
MDTAAEKIVFISSLFFYISNHKNRGLDPDSKSAKGLHPDFVTLHNRLDKPRIPFPRLFTHYFL